MQTHSELLAIRHTGLSTRDMHVCVLTIVGTHEACNDRYTYSEHEGE